MPVPACLRLQADVFPAVRAIAARHLLDEGWSQTRIAAFLGVSQAMVSKYGSSEAASSALATRLAEDLVQEALAPTPADGPGPWCATLTAVVQDPGMEAAMQDLLEAEQRLRTHPPLGLVPQIGMNLALALPGATTLEQVLAYPGRLVAAGDRIVPPAPPTLGASNHLAACLLNLRRHDPSLHALGSVRGGAVARAAGPDLVEMAGDEDRTRAFAAAVAGGAAEFVHDPGAFGIEPCLYIAGRDAVDVAAKILQIHARL